MVKLMYNAYQMIIFIKNVFSNLMVEKLQNLMQRISLENPLEKSSLTKLFGGKNAARSWPSCLTVLKNCSTRNLRYSSCMQCIQSCIRTHMSCILASSVPELKTSCKISYFSCIQN